MGILQAPQQITGTVGIEPNIKFMSTTDNFATITTAGYLNNIDLGVYPIQASDILFVNYSATTLFGHATFGIFSVSITNGIITLSQATNGSASVTLPTVAGRIATYTNTTGNLSENAATAINGGNIQAGLSGTAGTISSFPATAATGSLVLAGVSNTGNTTTTISNAAMAQASVISIPDPGAATANFVLNSGSSTMAAGSKIIFDKSAATATAGAATINKQSGILTTVALTTAAGASSVITLTNSEITTSSLILTSWMGGTNTVPSISISAVPAAGSATITINNIGPTAPLNGTVIVGFFVG